VDALNASRFVSSWISSLFEIFLLTVTIVQENWAYEIIIWVMFKLFLLSYVISGTEVSEDQRQDKDNGQAVVTQ